MYRHSLPFLIFSFLFSLSKSITHVQPHTLLIFRVDRSPPSYYPTIPNPTQPYPTYIHLSLNNLTLQRPNRHRPPIRRKNPRLVPRKRLPQLLLRLRVLVRLTRDPIYIHPLGRRRDEPVDRRPRGEIAADREDGVVEGNFALGGAFVFEVELNAGRQGCAADFEALME